MAIEVDDIHSRQRSLKEIAKSVAIFYAIACGFTWLVWLPLVLGPRRHAIWLILGPLLVFLCFFFIFPALLTKGGPSAWHWKLAALSGIWIPMFKYNLFGGPLFEEFGWRGLLQPRLQEVLPPWLAATVVGIMWSAWHLPLFLVGWSSATPLLFTFILIPLAVLMATAFNASGKMVPVAILMHSAFNASPAFLPGYLGDVPTRTSPSAEVLIGCSFLLLALVAIALTRGQLSATKPRGLHLASEGSQPNNP